MNRLLPMLLALFLALPPARLAHAAPPATVQTEVNYLLGLVEQSGCRFYRNGTWYDSKRAQEHLRYKYQFLADRDRIDTAEDFIEMAATKSSLSGRIYEVRCSDGTTLSSNRWLRDALRRYRLARGH